MFYLLYITFSPISSLAHHIFSPSHQSPPKPHIFLPARHVINFTKIKTKYVKWNPSIHSALKIPVGRFGKNLYHNLVVTNCGHHYEINNFKGRFSQICQIFKRPQKFLPAKFSKSRHPQQFISLFLQNFLKNVSEYSEKNSTFVVTVYNCYSHE